MQPYVQRIAEISPTQQLQPLDLVAPGFRGLNTVESGMLIDPQYCTTASNCVIDINGRLAARFGAAPITVTPVAGTPSIQTIFEYNLGGGVYQDIAAWNGGITNNIITPTNNLGGGVSVTNGRWFLQNFNNKCIGLQAGQKPIVYTGAGTFATVVESAGTAPSGGIGCAAFGRLWVVQSDGQTIQYSGLLDETDWSTTDGNAGLIDMHTIWSDGTDRVTAIFAWNASLVVCGLKHIIFFTDGRGSMLGMDPTQAYVFDYILGTGVVSQWTVDHIGEADVVFLSPNGLQSLQRLTTSRNNPLETLSKYNRDTLIAQMLAETSLNDITGVYNPTTGFYMLGLPTNGLTYCFDMRRLYNDDVGAQCSITTTWSMALTSSYVSAEPANGVYICRANQGTVCTYNGYQDEGSTYIFTYLSPWMNFGPQVGARLKMLKRLEILFFTSGNENFSVTWATDFGNTANQITATIPAFNITTGLYGIGYYGIATYGTSIMGQVYVWKYGARARGQYYQIGLTSTVTGEMALQQMQFAAKIGRIA